MRRALGLDGDSPRMRLPQERAESPPPRPTDRFTSGGVHVHKRRFIQDGDVPVTLVHGLTPNRREHADSGAARGATATPTNRLEIAESALAAEIGNRERAERSLADAQTTIRDLQTKLGHADLAQQEAVAALRREKEKSAELRAALQEFEDKARDSRQAHDMAERVAASLSPWAESQDDSTEPLPAARSELAPRRGRPPKQNAVGTVRPAAVPAKSAKGADGTPAREPKPVRWWLASKRSAKKA